MTCGTVEIRPDQPREAPRAPDAPDPHKEAEILAQHRERRQRGQEEPSGWRPALAAHSYSCSVPSGLRSTGRTPKRRQ